MFDIGVQAILDEKLTLEASGRQQVSGDQHETTGLLSVGVKF
jgi:hypothetical protein